MSLLDRLVPASALAWGALTELWPETLLFDSDDPNDIVRWLLRPDPAAAWGEADRRAEGEQ